MPVEGAPRGIPKDPVAGGGATIDILDDVGDVNAPAPLDGQRLTRRGSAWVPETPGVGGNLQRVQAIGNSGDYSITTVDPTWQDVDTGLDLVVPATVGDDIEITVSGYWWDEAKAGRMNVVTIVGGSHQNYVSPDVATGVTGWFSYPSVKTPISGSFPYTVQADDVVDDTVTLRLVANINAAGTKTLKADGATYQLLFSAKNLKSGTVRRFYQVTPDILHVRRGTEALFDEFDDDSIDAAWTYVDDPSSAHRTVTERGSVLGIHHDTSTDTAASLHAVMRDISGLSGPPLTIEAALRMRVATLVNYGLCGLMLADGVTPTAGTQVAAVHIATTAQHGIHQSVRHFTGYDSQTSTTSPTDIYHLLDGWWFSRLVWSASNTFDAYISQDGFHWFSIGQRTPTLTPTYAGIFYSTWDASPAPDAQYSVAYFRVYEADNPTDGLDVAGTFPHPPSYKLLAARSFR